jgi:hypothetical protein
MPRYSLLETAEYDEYARWRERGDREESSYSIFVGHRRARRVHGRGALTVRKRGTDEQGLQGFASLLAATRRCVLRVRIVDKT